MGLSKKQNLYFQRINTEKVINVLAFITFSSVGKLPLNNPNNYFKY